MLILVPCVAKIWAGEGLLFAGELRTLDHGLDRVSLVAERWRDWLQNLPKNNSTEIREHILTSN